MGFPVIFWGVKYDIYSPENSLFTKKRFHVGSPMLKFISGISIIPPKMATNWDLANKNWGVKHDMYWFNHHELIMV